MKIWKIRKLDDSLNNHEIGEVAENIEEEAAAETETEEDKDKVSREVLPK
ncbi:MAG: hypothetical protein ACI8RA_002952 [Chlamydiales bacterium]|jgi:hypothetical protein